MVTGLLAAGLLPLCACRSGYAFQSAVGGFSVRGVRAAVAPRPAVDTASMTPAEKTTEPSNNRKHPVLLI